MTTPLTQVAAPTNWPLEKHIDTDAAMTANSDARVPSQRAVRKFVENRQAFPVGALFISILATNPADPAMLGYGTWVAHATGRVLIGVDPLDADFTPAGKTGGAKTITIPNHANHTHQVDCNVGVAMTAVDAATPTLPVVSSIAPLSVISFGESVPLAHVDSGTGLSAIKTMPPYIAVYFWVRTA